MPKLFPRKVHPLGCILAAFFVLGLVYDTITPIFEAIDEHHHVAFVRSLATGHGLPVQDPRNLQAWRQEGSQAPLYYLLGALTTFWIDTEDFSERLRLNPHAIIGVPEYATNDNRNLVVHTAAEGFPYQRTTLAVHLLRWLSLLMGMGTVGVTFQLAQQMTERQSVAILAAALVAFNPMFLYINSSVNNDNLVTLLATLSLLLTVRVWRRGVSSRRIVALGLVSGLTALSKASALGLLGVVGLVVLVQALRASQSRHESARALMKNLLVSQALLCIPILAIAGWWYARNLLLYGDLTALNTLFAMLGTRPSTPPLLPLLQSEAEGLWLSFWGVFGWFNILAAPGVYVSLNVLSLSALVGLSWYLMTVRRTGQVQRASALWWLGLWWLVLFVEWVRYSQIIEAAQGRLFFPAISVVAIAFAIGLTTLMPRRTVRLTTTLLSLMLFLIALRVALFDIHPAYVPVPFVSQVPTTMARNPIRFADALELIGLGTLSPSTHPAETFSIVVYWKTLAPMNHDYSVFVHLLGEGELSVGQRDTYPGLGLRPTTQLRAGDIIRDVYRISIDPATLAPSQPQIRMGVYDVETGQRLNATIQNQPVGDNPLIGQIELLAKEGSHVPNPLRFDFEQYFALIGYEIDRVVVRAGDSFQLTLYWQSHRFTPTDYTIFAHVLGQNDSLWGQVDRQLPTTTWLSGQTMKDVYSIPVMLDTPEGVYHIELGAYDVSHDLQRLNVWDAQSQLVGNRVLLREIRVRGKRDQPP